MSLLVLIERLKLGIEKKKKLEGQRFWQNRLEYFEFISGFVYLKINEMQSVVKLRRTPERRMSTCNLMTTACVLVTLLPSPSSNPSADACAPLES